MKLKPAYHPKLQLIIFDLDGTLVDAYPAVASSVNFTLQALGFVKKDKETIRRAVGWGDRQLLTTFVGEKLVDKALKIYRRHHAQALKTGTHFLPGALKVLKTLKKQKYKLAIASNRPTRYTLIILKILEIRDYFNYVLCADKLKKGKPDPQILLKILERMKVPADEALYAGDMTIDVQTGKRAKVKTVAVTTGSSEFQELNALKPLCIIPRIDDLIKVIKK